MATQGSTVIYRSKAGVLQVAFVDKDNGDGTANLRSLLNAGALVHNVTEDAALSAPNTFKVVVVAST